MQVKDSSVSTQAKSRGNSVVSLELDIRPIFASGASPCGTIDRAVASLKPGQPFVLLAPFEPIPLFTKLAAQGYEHKSETLPDGSWRILFEHAGDKPESPTKHQGCCCSEEP
jgi:uncharacterized protein (DUF2249 family)